MSQRQPLHDRRPDGTDDAGRGGPPPGVPEDPESVVEVDQEPAGEDVLADAGPPDGDEEYDDGPYEAEDIDEQAEEAEEAVEADIDALAHLTAQRDEYLNALRHLQADFENYRKRMLRQQTEHTERAAESLVAKLLPVLDGFELAVAHGHPDLEPVYRSLVTVLEQEGLERIDAEGSSFDPSLHEAVAHEPSEGDDGPEVAEVMRAGYCFKGRVLRPAMVKVRG